MVSKTPILLALEALLLIAPICLLVFPVYADPGPMPSKPFNWTEYFVEVIVSEVVAWIIGAELLWRLSRKRKQEITRVEIYTVMLEAMIVSFLIGFLFWKIFGWI